MAKFGLQSVGSVFLWLSTMTFGVYFLNVLMGGPLGRKPWMSDIVEMLILFLAVVFFVAGTIAREAQDGPHAVRPDRST